MQNQVFQSHEAEPPMAVVIRQHIYEDLQLQTPELGIRIGVGYRCASDACPACWGNSEGRWEGFAARPDCWKREDPEK